MPNRIEIRVARSHGFCFLPHQPDRTPGTTLHPALLGWRPYGFSIRRIFSSPSSWAEPEKARKSSVRPLLSSLGEENCPQALLIYGRGRSPLEPEGWALFAQAYAPQNHVAWPHDRSGCCSTRCFLTPRPERSYTGEPETCWSAGLVPNRCTPWKKNTGI